MNKPSIFEPTAANISAASNILRSGGLVAFPTETVYGLGANAFDANAVAKIFIAKERPAFDPLIVHISDLADLERISPGRDTRVFELAKAFWPGPLTIIMAKSKNIPDIVTSGLPDVAVRMPSHNVALQLIKQTGFPIAAPSANKFGKLSPTTARHVMKQLTGVEMIIDGGACKVGVESTVIRLENDGFRILRYGAITEKMLTAITPKSQLTEGFDLPQASPGLMKSHYSPDKQLFIVGEHAIPSDTSRAAYVSFKPTEKSGFKMARSLSSNGELQEAAVGLFRVLHELEEADVDFIVVETVPENGIGIAIMDRLRKAAWRFQNPL